MGMTNPNPYKTSGDKGAAAELLVCADLLAKGLHVYRAVSPSAPADLVVLGNNGAIENVLLVEVKSRQYLADGTPNNNIKTAGSGKFDILAMVMPDGKIIYESEHRLLMALGQSETS